MNTPDRARAIFHSAVEKASPADREAYLAEACGNDAYLRRRVEALLAAYDEPASFLERAAVAPDSQEAAPTVLVEKIREECGSVIGPYKLLQEIGQGGMGVVFMAEQTTPVRRRVALKIIKPGMDSQQVIARFEAERQALAMMEHPNIARVLDAGATEAGRPYFVMELVKGVPITDYCNHNRLTPRERLELFIPVCEAIQHAHQKGIIHRDIKPSNVLVSLYDGRPTPKVIDFGVAKAVEQRLTERTMFTQYGQIVGTLEYMSPEQAEMNQLDVDTRSDIYSLGVLLYELLTGSTPIPKEMIREVGLVEMLRLIREAEPEKPSTRLSRSQESLASISAQRRSEPAKLGALLRRELDWIVMKSLEKDRTRRYPSASDFSRDIQRYLNDETVEACPPSIMYRVQKFARRHKPWIAAAAALAAMLVIATAVSAFSAIQADQAMRGERLARQEQASQLRQTEAERKRAVQAEQRAQRHRERALEAAHAALDQLSRTRFLGAKALLATSEPGRRWTALEMLRGAEGLRTRKGVEDLDALLSGERGPDLGEAMGLAAALGDADRELSQAELRSQAVAALLLHDGRVAHQWEGRVHAASPDGRFVAAALDARTGSSDIRILETETGREVEKLRRPRGVIPVAAALSTGAARLALFSVNNANVSLELHEMKGREEPRSLTIPGTDAGDDDQRRSAFPRMFHSLQFSPDAQWLMGTRSGEGASSEVLLWDLRENAAPEGRVLATIDVRPQSRPAFSPDSRLAAWVAGGQEIVLWNLSDEQDERRLELPLYLDAVVAFTPDGGVVVAHGHHTEDAEQSAPEQPGAVLVWDVDENRLVGRFPTSPAFLATAISVSPDGRRVAAGQMNGEVLVLGVSDDAAIRLDHGAMPWSLCWGPQSDRIISAGIGLCRVWELSLSTPLARRTLQTEAGDWPVSRFAVSSDGRQIAVEWREASAIEIYRLRSGEKVRRLQADSRLSIPGASLFFSPNGKRLARIALGAVWMWDLDGDGEPREISRIVFQGSMVSSAGFREDGALLLAGFDQFRPAVIEALSGEMVWRHDERLRSSAPHLSRDASLVLFHGAPQSGNDPPTIEVRRLPSGDVVQRIPSGEWKPASHTIADISPDNRWLIGMEVPATSPIRPSLSHPLMQPITSNIIGGAGEGWQATLWSVETGRQHWQIGGDAKMEATAFSPDGRYFAVTQRNGRVILWDVEQKQRLFDWQAWPGATDALAPSRDVAFADGGGFLVVAAETGAAFRLVDLQRLNQELAAVGLGW